MGEKEPATGARPFVKDKCRLCRGLRYTVITCEESVTPRRKGEVMDFELIKFTMLARIWIKSLDAGSNVPLSNQVDGK